MNFFILLMQYIQTFTFADRVKKNMSFNFSLFRQVLSSTLKATSQRSLNLQNFSPLGGFKSAQNIHTTTQSNGQQSEQWLRKLDQALMKNNGFVKRKPSKPSKMFGRPQIRGTVIRIFVKKPMKPNSANVRLSNGKLVVAHIPGEGHTLQEHNQVIVRGGRVSDLAGVHHKIVRGKLDCAAVVKKS